MPIGRRLAPVLMALLLAPLPAAGERHPLFYSAKPIAGTVVDADTGQPLEGVIVLAQWVLVGDARIQVAEVVTGAGGKYLIPGWGPKPRPPFAPLTGYGDPQIMLFKPSYAPLFLDNRVLDNFDSVRTSDWDGKTVQLQRFRGSAEEWVRQLDLMQGELGVVGQFTHWQQHPRMLLAVFEEIRRLPEKLRGRVSTLGVFGTSEEELRAYVEREKK